MPERTSYARHPIPGRPVGVPPHSHVYFLIADADAAAERVKKLALANADRLKKAVQRRDPKKSVSSSAHSAASSPPATTGRWFMRGSARTSSTDPAAPAFGSVVP